jgi:hypothetical protein
MIVCLFVVAVLFVWDSQGPCVSRARHKHVYAGFLIMPSKRYLINKQRPVVMFCPAPSVDPMVALRYE